MEISLHYSRKSHTCTIFPLLLLVSGTDPTTSMGILLKGPSVGDHYWQYMRKWQRLWQWQRKVFSTLRYLPEISSWNTFKIMRSKFFRIINCFLSGAAPGFWMTCFKSLFSKMEEFHWAWYAYSYDEYSFRQPGFRDFSSLLSTTPRTSASHWSPTTGYASIPLGNNAYNLLSEYLWVEGLNWNECMFSPVILVYQLAIPVKPGTCRL